MADNIVWDHAQIQMILVEQGLFHSACCFGSSKYPSEQVTDKVHCVGGSMREGGILFVGGEIGGEILAQI